MFKIKLNEGTKKFEVVEKLKPGTWRNSNWYNFSKGLGEFLVNGKHILHASMCLSELISKINIERAHALKSLLFSVYNHFLMIFIFVTLLEWWNTFYSIFRSVQ